MNPRVNGYLRAIETGTVNEYHNAQDKRKKGKYDSRRTRKNTTC